MSATNRRKKKAASRLRTKQGGVAAVEFAIVALLFFTIVFGIIEFVRVMYMFNTLSEVTRSMAHAAANISFNDGDGLTLARKHAVFDGPNGSLPFGNPVTYENIRVEYLYLPSKTSALQMIPAGSMPACPARNVLNCMNDPNSASCIRAVQVRICKEGTTAGTCTPVNYQPLISFINLSLKLPTALTIVNAETLGYKTGDVPCS